MLREMFTDHPKMQLTQDSKGNIRMVETGVQSDLLDVRIVQVSFSSGSHILNNGNEALWQVMDTPDVKNYLTSNNIGPVMSDFHLIIGPSSPNAPKISGDLYYVTFSEALDYVLKTYPGFWAYETCESKDGGRTVYLDFFPTVPYSVSKFP